MEELLAIESAALGTLWAIAPLAGMAAIALCLGICAATGRKPGAASIGWACPMRR